MAEGFLQNRRFSRFLLDRFKGAAAAYSLRDLTLLGRGNPVVKVRRSVDDTEQDFNPAQINDGTLEQFVNAGDVAPADYGTGAAAAYSLRHVSDGYTGDVVRVRRSVDSTEQDFNPTEVQDGTLTSFVGGQNLFSQSQFNVLGGFWSNTRSTVTQNDAVAPDGTTTALSLKQQSGETASGFIRNVVGNVFVLPADDATISIFAKPNGKNWLIIREDFADGEINSTWFDVQNGVVGTSDAAHTASIEASANGYYRCSIKVTLNASRTSAGLIFYLADTDGSFTVADDTNGLYLWGAQLEQSATLGDYVPTTSTIAGDGHVTTWYDQSGNSNDATQATAASQPKIVSGGSLVTENGKPAIDFDGVDDWLRYAGDMGVSQPFAIFALFNPYTDTNYYVYDNAQRALIGDNSSQGFGFYAGTSWVRKASTLANQQSLSFVNFDGASSTHNINGTTWLDGDGGSAGVSTNFIIGSNFQIGPNYLDGTIQEIIVYSDDQSSNRELIETNVNHYYSIYSQTNDGFVTTWYDQSGNGNHATQATAASQPKIVSAGSLVVENGKAALDFDGSDDYFSASSWGISGTQDRSFFITAKADANDSSTYYLGIGDGTGFFIPPANKWRISTETAIRVTVGAEIYGSPSTVQALVAHIFSGTDVTDNTAYINGTESVATSSSPNTISTDDTFNEIGNRAEGTTTDTFNGKYQELLIYATDQSAKRQQIESNINTHYGIY